MTGRTVRYAVAVFAGVIALALGGATAHAASPKFVVSWTADSFAPSWYDGKVFPSQHSNVRVAFELIGQSKADYGKLMNLSDKQVRWYVNDRFYSQKQGLQSITVPLKLVPGTSVSVRISSEYYDADSDSVQFADDYITVPIAAPEVAISYTGFDNTASPNSTVQLSAAPFFFDVSDIGNLSAIWSVGDQQSDKNAQDPFQLSATLGPTVSPGPLTFGINVQNIGNLMEQAANSITFNIQ